MPDLSLVILAAGIGSRYGGLKQLDPAGPHGEPIMAYSIHDAARAGFRRVVFVVREEIEPLLRDKMGRHGERSMETAYVHQGLPPGRAKPWGTAHAVLCAEKAVPGPFMTVNADDLCGPEAFRLIAQALSKADPTGREQAMVAFSLANTLSPHGPVSRGVCRLDDDGYLVGVAERGRIQERDGEVRFLDGGEWRALPADAPVSLNLWGFLPGFFGDLKQKFEEFTAHSAGDPRAEFGLPQTVGALVDEGRIRVRVLRSAERWYGVSYREDLESVQSALREMIERGVYPERLWD
jgi:dTDP-glucose pyrophosphorylase